MRRALLGLVVLTIASLTSVLAAANTVAVTHAAEIKISIGANDLKPSECASLTLSNLVTGSGAINGTGSSDLVLGSSSIDTVLAGSGNDCVLGGGGNDVLSGGPDTDVCIGGPGTDVLDSTCETQYQ